MPKEVRGNIFVSLSEAGFNFVASAADHNMAIPGEIFGQSPDHIPS